MFYYNIIFKKGNKLGGHNCTDFETKDGFLIVQGYDDIPYVDGTERQYWKFKYELSEIKEFKIEKMNEEN